MSTLNNIITSLLTTERAAFIHRYGQYHQNIHIFRRLDNRTDIETLYKDFCKAPDPHSLYHKLLDKPSISPRNELVTTIAYKIYLKHGMYYSTAQYPIHPTSTGDTKPSRVAAYARQADEFPTTAEPKHFNFAALCKELAELAEAIQQDLSSMFSPKTTP